MSEHAKQMGLNTLNSIICLLPHIAMGCFLLAGYYLLKEYYPGAETRLGFAVALAAITTLPHIRYSSVLIKQGNTNGAAIVGNFLGLWLIINFQLVIPTTTINTSPALLFIEPVLAAILVILTPAYWKEGGNHRKVVPILISITVLLLYLWLAKIWGAIEPVRPYVLMAVGIETLRTMAHLRYSSPEH